MLRIGHPGGLRGEIEEVGVELVDAVQDRRPPDIRRIGEDVVADTGSAKCLGGQRGDRLLAAAEVVPER